MSFLWAFWVEYQLAQFDLFWFQIKFTRVECWPIQIRIVRELSRVVITSSNKHSWAKDSVEFFLLLLLQLWVVHLLRHAPLMDQGELSQLLLEIRKFSSLFRNSKWSNPKKFKGRRKACKHVVIDSFPRTKWYSLTSIVVMSARRTETMRDQA